MILNPFVFGGGGGATPYYDAIMADSPALYLRLDELTGAPINYGSATLTGGSYVTGSIRGEPSLCGDAGDYAVNIPGTGRVQADFAAGAVFPANDFTMEALIVLGSNGFRPIMSGHVPSNLSAGVPLLRVNGNKLNFLRSQVADLGSSTTSLATLTTYHVAVTVSSGGLVTFYLNGAADGTGSAYASFPTNNESICVGQEQTIYNLFDGIIDEVAVYHTALSGTQLAAHAAAAGL